MVSVLKLQCPNCGAPLQAGSADQQVVCAYCKHISLLVRRGAPPPPESSSPEYHTVVVPSVGAPIGLLVAGFLLSLGIAGAIFVFVVQEKSISIPQALDERARMDSERDLLQVPFQFSDLPLLIDLNDDAQPEIIGLTRAPAGPAWIAAYDGKTLAPLWKTAPLSKDAADANARRAVLPGLVLSADALGKLQAYSAHTGQPAWATLIGERVESFCLGEGFVRVRSTDKIDHDLDLTTGKRIERQDPQLPQSNPERRPGARGDCVPVHASRGQDGPAYSLVSWSEFNDHGLPGLHDVEGITAHRALVLRGTDRAFLLGGKSTGTRYPLVAAVEGKKVLWQDAVAGVDPMTSDSNPTTQLAAFFDGKLAVPYEIRGGGGVRMALFDGANGKRLWDMPVHQKNAVENGLIMSGDTIYYATWTAVYLLEARTGKQRAILGQEF